MIALSKEYVMKNQNKKLLLILCLSIILSACGKSEEISPLHAFSSPSGNEETVNGYSEEIIEVSKVGSKFENFFKRVSFDYETNCLKLYDDMESMVLKEIKYDNNSFAQNIYKYRDGYAVQVIFSDQPVKVIKYEKGKVYKFPDNILQHFVYIYDNSLNLLKKIPIDSAVLKNALGSYIGASDDGSKILITDSQRLYICDTSSGSINSLSDELNNDVVFKQALFTGDNENIVYIGSSQLVDTRTCVYGLINIDTGKMTKHFVKDYFASHITLSENYAILCDNENPDGFGGYKNGRVPILNLETNESFIIQVDTTESAFAQVTHDGKYLMAIKETDEGIRIRLYDIDTEKVKKEKLIAYEDRIYKVSRILYSGNAKLYYFVCVAENGLFLYPFDCEDY